MDNWIDVPQARTAEANKTNTNAGFVPRAQEDSDSPELPPGYQLDTSDPDMLVLRRPDGSVIGYFPATIATASEVARMAEEQAASQARDAKDEKGRMWARVWKTRVRPENIDEYVRYCQGVTSEAEKQPGFRGTHLIANPNSGEVMGMSVWENKACLLASGEQLEDYQRFVREVGKLLTESLTIEHYEVRISP